MRILARSKKVAGAIIAVSRRESCIASKTWTNAILPLDKQVWIISLSDSDYFAGCLPVERRWSSENRRPVSWLFVINHPKILDPRPPSSRDHHTRSRNTTEITWRSQGWGPSTGRSIAWPRTPRHYCTALRQRLIFLRPMTIEQSPRMRVREPTTTLRAVLPHCHCFLPLIFLLNSQCP